MNQILGIVIEHLSKGRKITEISPHNSEKKITVFFEKGEQSDHEIDAATRDEFFELWKHATAYMRVKWNELS